MSPEASRIQHLLELGRHAEASAAAASALAESPHDSDLLRLLGWARYGMHDLDAAGHAVAAAITRDPDGAEGLRLATYVRLACGDTHEAVRAARECARLAPLSAPAHVALSHACYADGDALAGWWAAKQAIVLDPEDPDVLVVMGVAEAERGALHRAEALFGRALRIDPSHAEAIAHLAWHQPPHRVLRRLRGALAAQRLDPQEPLAASLLDGVTLYLVGWLSVAAMTMAVVGVVGVVGLGTSPLTGLVGMGVVACGAVVGWFLTPGVFRRSRRQALRRGFGSWGQLCSGILTIGGCTALVVALACGLQLPGTVLGMLASCAVGAVVGRWIRGLRDG